MKKGLLTAGILLAGFITFAGTMTVVGKAMMHPVQSTVFTVAREETQLPTEQIDFPLEIPQTTLTAERMVLYEGPAIEQSSDDPLGNTLALMLHNTGNREVLSAHIQLRAEGVTHSFSGSYIPAQSRILLIESDNALWPAPPYTGVTGTATYAADQNLLESRVEVRETGMAEVTITNLTEKTLKEVYILHKNCLSDGDLYIGGITYRTGVGDLKGGEAVSISLDHYASGYSKVVCVEGKTEE